MNQLIAPEFLCSPYSLQAAVWTYVPIAHPSATPSPTLWEFAMAQVGRVSVRQDDSPGTVAGPKYVNEEEVVLTTITLKFMVVCPLEFLFPF